MGSLDQQEDPAHTGTQPGVSSPRPPPAACTPSRRGQLRQQRPRICGIAPSRWRSTGGRLSSEKPGRPPASAQAAWGSERGPRLLLRGGEPWVSLLRSEPAFQTRDQTSTPQRRGVRCNLSCQPSSSSAVSRPPPTRLRLPPARRPRRLCVRVSQAASLRRPGRSNRTAAEKPARGLEHTTDALQLKTFVLFLKFV